MPKLGDGLMGQLTSFRRFRLSCCWPVPHTSMSDIDPGKLRMAQQSREKLLVGFCNSKLTGLPPLLLPGVTANFALRLRRYHLIW